MPAMPMSEVIVLALILAAFAAFGLTLLAVSIYVSLGGQAPGTPAPREVTPARRVAAVHH
jgi:hypothetical protein